MAYDGIVKIAEFYVPLGFYDQKDFIFPISSIIKSFAYSECFDVFGDPTRKSLLRNLVTLMVFWINHPFITDSFFAGNVIDSMTMFIKSGIRENNK